MVKLQIKQYHYLSFLFIYILHISLILIMFVFFQFELRGDLFPLLIKLHDSLLKNISITNSYIYCLKI